MLRRKSSTILLLTAEQIVRADISGGRIKALWREPRPAVDDLPMLVDSALRMGGKCRGKVWVLTTDLWTQALPVESGATRGASQEELAQALAFEVEPLSGISAFESVIGHKALHTDGFHRHFWVIQMPIWQMEQVEESIRMVGGTLGGIAHPGGLPRGVSQRGASSSWRRVELWPDCVVAVQAVGGKGAEVHVEGVSPSQESWKQPLRDWFETHGPAEQRVLLLSRSADFDRGLQDETEVLDLNDEISLKSWLSAWSETLGYREVGVPLIQPAAQSMTVQTQVVISAALATFVAVGCWALERTSQAKIETANVQIAELNQKAEDFKALDGEIKSRTDQLKTRTDENERLVTALDTYEDSLAAQRQRLAILLTSVAEHRPEHLIIRKIDQRGGNLTITGMSLDPEAANDLAVNLERRLRRYGWKVGLPKQQSGERTSDRKPWTFTMELTSMKVSPRALEVVEKRRDQPVSRELSPDGSEPR